MSVATGERSAPAATVQTRPRAVPRPTVAGITQIATYATTLAGIYLSVGFLFYFAMKEKLFTDGGTMPLPLQKLFHGSFFASVPGDNVAWVLLGLIELRKKADKSNQTKSAQSVA